MPFPFMSRTRVLMYASVSFSIKCVWLSITVDPSISWAPLVSMETSRPRQAYQAALHSTFAQGLLNKLPFPEFQCSFSDDGCGTGKSAPHPTDGHQHPVYAD